MVYTYIHLHSELKWQYEFNQSMKLAKLVSCIGHTVYVLIINDSCRHSRQN